MTFVRDGDRVSAINKYGRTVAYIEKNRMGTHGHWHGWMHYMYCYYRNEIIWTGVDENFVSPSRPHSCWVHWTEAPTWFPNIKEFKDYYKDVKEEI